MSRRVFCRKYQCEMEGLLTPPFPGSKGQDIFDNVSQQAWNEWLAQQTMLINEKHLNMMDASARDYLGEQRNKFLSGQEHDSAEGYIPPSK